MTYPSNSDGVAQDQIKAFVDRILRMKGEVKALNADIREIYGEAKAVGFDKTVLGKLVGYVEKREADANAVMESESIFDLYLSAYDGASGKVGTKRATHTHAPEDRAARAKERLSEAMDDNKALSAEMLADGLISEKAHAENVALSDAVATKLGAGVVDAVAALRADPAMSIVDAGEIKKSEPQPAPQAESDLTRSHAPENGQVADNPEAKASEDDGATVPGEAPADSVTGDASRASVGAGTDATILPETANDDRSCVSVLGGLTQSLQQQATREGETARPLPSTNSDPKPMYADPGVITWESCPPEPVERHEYSAAFGDLGQDIEVITENMREARSAPIVKVKNKILDGWARYMKARELGIEYPVVQYDGSDWLVDCIKWNVAGRILTNQHKQIIAARLIKIYPQRKGIILAVLAGEDIGV